MKKIIEDNELFSILTDVFDKLPITIRQWKHTNTYIDVKVDDYFAQSNGYKSVKDMVKKTIGAEKFKELFGGVPEWITVTADGQFIFKNIDKTKCN